MACGQGLNNTEVTRELGVTMPTVGKWRQWFVERRLDGLLDEPRPGAPRKISDAAVERVITKTLESKPKNATHWSTRSMALSTGLNQTAISRIWRAFALQPHRSETFKLSSDPQFIDKVRDIEPAGFIWEMRVQYWSEAVGCREKKRRPSDADSDDANSDPPVVVSSTDMTPTAHRRN